MCLRKTQEDWVTDHCGLWRERSCQWLVCEEAEELEASGSALWVAWPVI